MALNKSPPEDSFFSDQQEDPHSNPLIVQEVPQINTHLIKLPANELRTVRRPQEMKPRSFFLERPFGLLPAPLNQPQTQLPRPRPRGKLKLKIANNQTLSIEEYFGKKKFNCLYNRLEGYHKDNTSFQGRFKSVDALVDYNQRCYRELQQQPALSIHLRDAIDSDFESGNLCKAYINPQDPNEYFLLTESDLNTHGYNNWFFFRFRNVSGGIRRFTLVNLIKKTNFYAQGMLVSIFSMRKQICFQEGWFKGGDNVTFGSVNLPRVHHQSDNYHFLSFEYDFEFQHDTVYFAMNQPYTYSRMVSTLNSLHTLSTHPKGTLQFKATHNPNLSVEIKNIGYSIANNIIPSVKLSRETPNRQNKDVILLLARQHPCQTVGSFIAEGILHYLTRQNNRIIDFLMDEFDVVMVPMVNPDGVIHGSSRCNMGGFDLNRQWGDSILKELTPETVKIKQFISNLSRSQKIKYMIDLHGHGKKLNSFFFSCKENERDDVRLFSSVMKTLEPRFSMEGCTYGITRDKENTIRSTINSMGIAHSYTLETSLYGYKQQQTVRHFNEQDYQHIAKNLLHSIFVMEAGHQLILSELGISKEAIRADMEKSVREQEKEEEWGDQNSILSDSDPEGDKLQTKDLLGKCQNKALKKKLQEEMEKEKNKIKSKKSEKKLLVTNKSSKNIRESSCKSALAVKGKTPSSSTVKEKKEHLRTSSSNKISLSQKWKERRKEIELKKKEKSNKETENAYERMNYTKMQTRPRLKTDTSITRPKIHLPYSNFMAKSHLSKTRHLHQKIKTEFREFEDYNPPSQEEIRENQIRKSALETKYRQLKQESLNILLTDTLSVLKIAPHTKTQIKESKILPSKSSKEHLATEPNLHNSSKVVIYDEQNLKNKDSVRYKKFRNFLTSGSLKKKGGEPSSVFYHFPIL